MLLLPLGSKCSLSTYFLPRIKWLQNGSQILFGQVCNDCVYILIDTSHSMKSKLDLVKDKIVQFVQVSQNCQVHGCDSLLFMNASPPIITCRSFESYSGEVCTKKSTGKPHLPVRESSVLLCKQTLP